MTSTRKRSTILLSDDPDTCLVAQKAPQERVASHERMTVGTTRVLLVEDDEDDYILTRDMLAAVEGTGYTVDWVATYEEAAEAINRREHDVYLLDYRLGSHTGMDLVRAVVAAGAPAPGILLTGLRDRHINVDAMEAGAADYLIKGEMTSALLERAIRYARGCARLGRLRNESLAVVMAERERHKIIGELTSDFAYGYRVLPDGAVDRQWLSGAFERITGYTPEALDDAGGWEDLIHPDDRTGVQGRWEALRLGKAYLGEYRIIAKDGSVRWLRESLRGRRAEDERDWTGYGAVQEITARKIAEEDRDRFFLLVQDLLSISTLDGNFLDVNPAFEQSLGYALDELRAMSLLQFIHPSDLAATTAAMQKLTVDGVTVAFESRFRCKDGSYQWLLWTSRLILPRRRIYSTARDITGSKRAVAQMQSQVERLSALRLIDLAISTNMDLRSTLDVLLQQVIRLLEVDAADVLLYNTETQILEFGADCGMLGGSLRRIVLPLGQGLAGQVALERRIIEVPDLTIPDPRVVCGRDFAAEDFIVYFGVPLIAKGEVQGVLELFHRSPRPVDDEWRGFMELLAGQAAIAVDNSRLYEGLQRSNTDLRLAYDTTIEGWSRALDLRDKETEGHSQRVTARTLRLARAMSISAEELVQMRRGALLHDIGKMGVPDAILLKPGPLTDEEWIVMRKHPTHAYDLLTPIAYLRAALDIPYCHHEKWDGTGYPRGLRGEQIPLAARIFAVADVADALLSDRPYRAAWSPEKMRAHIASMAGNHFDPEVVAVFLVLIDEDGVR